MNADALKDFLFRHVEKFIFAMLTLVAVFLIYQGFLKPDILAKHQPDKMQQSATQVKTSIDDDHWESIKEPRLPTFNVVARTNETIKPVDSTPYGMAIPWEAKSIDLSIKRTDPKIPAPIEVRVTGVVASLAIKSNGEYPLKALESADVVEKVKAKPKPKPKRSRMMMMDDMGSSGEGDYDSSMDMEMDMEMDGSYGFGMEGMGAAGPVRKLDATLYDQGFRPTTAVSETQPVLGQFIAGVALMPHKQIYQAFEEALSQADGYNTQRDQPYYMGFELQRADVTDKPVDQLVDGPDGDWVSRGTSRYYQLLLLRVWSGMAKEVVAGKYRDPELTSAIPPVLLDHYTWFSMHPKIPIGDEPLPGTMPMGPKKEAISMEPILPGEGADAFRGRGRTGGMIQQGYGDSSMMEGGYGDYGSPYGFNAKVEQPDHKLIRFYDFRDFTGRDTGAPQPGRKYVYRVRVAVEDPNFPSNPAADPGSGSLSSDVFRRVEKLKLAAAEKLKKNPQSLRNSTLLSEYSAPSPVVSLPSLTQAFVGPIDPGTVKTYDVGTSKVQFQSKPPKGKMVVAQWSPKYGAPLPVVSDVTRGSVVNKTGVIDIPDPLTLEVKKTPEETVNTSNVVLDLTGGDPLGIYPHENQTQPGMALMFDPSGGLKVIDEIETQRGYRLYSAADQRGE